MKPYPQMPPFTQDELVAFLNEAPVARLSSMNPDGTIHGKQLRTRRHSR